MLNLLNQKPSNIARFDGQIQAEKCQSFSVLVERNEKETSCNTQGKSMDCLQSIRSHPLINPKKPHFNQSLDFRTLAFNYLKGDQQTPILSDYFMNPLISSKR